MSCRGGQGGFSWGKADSGRGGGVLECCVLLRGGTGPDQPTSLYGHHPPAGRSPALTVLSLAMIQGPPAVTGEHSDSHEPAANHDLSRPVLLQGATVLLPVCSCLQPRPRSPPSSGTPE